MMKTAISIILSLSLILSVNIPFAQDSKYRGINNLKNVYINSDPLGAEVRINGEEVGNTPVRIILSEVGELNIHIQKEGYNQVKEKVKLGSERSCVYFFKLFPLTMSIVLPQKGEELYIDHISAGKTPLIIENLPDGKYEMSKKPDRIYISRAKEKGVTRGAVVEALFCTALSGVSFAGMQYYRDRGKQLESHTLGFSSFIFGLLTGYNLLKFYKANLITREEEKIFYQVNVKPYRVNEAKEYFTEGMELLGKKEWEKARIRFNLVIKLFPHSEFVPISMYEVGYCSFKIGKFSEAAEMLKRFLKDYPVYEIFSYGVYYLLVARMEEGKDFQAIQEYRSFRPVYLEDPGGDLQRDFYDLMIKLYQKTGDKSRYILDDLLSELDYFLEQNVDSPSYPRIYFMKGNLLFRYLDREKGLEVFRDLKEKYQNDKELISEMEKVIHG